MSSTAMRPLETVEVSKYDIEHHFVVDAEEGKNMSDTKALLGEMKALLGESAGTSGNPAQPPAPAAKPVTSRSLVEDLDSVLGRPASAAPKSGLLADLDAVIEGRKPTFEAAGGSNGIPGSLASSVVPKVNAAEKALSDAVGLLFSGAKDLPKSAQDLVTRIHAQVKKASMETKHAATAVSQLYKHESDAGTGTSEEGAATFDTQTEATIVIAPKSGRDNIPADFVKDLRATMKRLGIDFKMGDEDGSQVIVPKSNFPNVKQLAAKHKLNAYVLEGDSLRSSLIEADDVGKLERELNALKSMYTTHFGKYTGKEHDQILDKMSELHALIKKLKNESEGPELDQKLAEAVDKALATPGAKPLMECYGPIGYADDYKRDPKDRLRSLVYDLAYGVRELAMEGIGDDGRRLDYKKAEEAKFDVYDAIVNMVLKTINVKMLEGLAVQGRGLIEPYLT